MRGAGESRPNVIGRVSDEEPGDSVAGVLPDMLELVCQDAGTALGPAGDLGSGVPGQKDPAAEDERVRVEQPGGGSREKPRVEPRRRSSGVRFHGGLTGSRPGSCASWRSA